MKTSLLVLFGLILYTFSFGQRKMEIETKAIVDEGKKLYRSEMASWYGTDLFLEKFPDQRHKIGGYFSYTEDNLAKCIFFSTGNEPKVIGTITFDETYNIDSAKIDGSERDFTAYERDLYSIRKTALAEIHSDTLFKTYKNSNLNLVPLVEGNDKKVYVLTGPTVQGVVIIGNDYLLTFDKNNKLLNKKQLHQNILFMKYSDKEGIAMHTHLPETGEYITATDICTTMLYEKSANWKQHIVMSKKYVSIWDCKKDELFTITKVAWDRMSEDVNKR